MNTQYYTLLIVVCATTLLGGAAGIVGAFALVRKQTLLADAIAHACLPGVALALLLTHNTHPLILMAGALCSAGIALGCIHGLQRFTLLKIDAILGTTLSAFFGLGLVGTTIAQKYAISHQAALNAIIFGNAATVNVHDITIAAYITFFVLLCIGMFWKELKLLAFDHAYAQTRGYATDLLHLLLTFLMIMIIALGLHMIGVVLISTMLVAPAAAARLWSSHFNNFVGMSSFFGAIFGIIGTLISSMYAHMPTGPVIAVVAILFVLTCLASAPRIRSSGRITTGHHE